MSVTDDKEITIKTFLLNKRERYGYEVKEIRRDSRKDEVKALIGRIVESENDMYERRKSIQGFDFIMAEGKVRRDIIGTVNFNHFRILW